MNESISDIVVEVLTGFNRLSKSIQEFDDTSLRASLPPKIDDELARFKVWAGNSGAHRTGRGSLEHRLRDASHVRQQVLRLLGGLKDSLEDAADIMNGKATPWEEIEDDEEPLDDFETETEMEQIALDITELVDCLLRLSVSIQNPAPHDRFMSSTFTDTSAYEDFDIQHVQAKFQNIDEGLAQRLGKAMSRRRQYFKYREAHHLKLSHGLDRHGDTNKTESTLPAPSTLASSIPLQMKQELLIDLLGDDTQSDGRASVTSFATSVSGPKTLKVPPMPEDAFKGPFMCPFCYLIVSVQDTRAWKKHVFGDLRPYNCLAVHCTAPDREFSRRNEWMQHMLQDHLRVYRCPYDCPDNFSSATESRDHLLRAHSRAIPESKIDSIVELSSQPLAQDANIRCPFCLEKLKSLKQYRRHVGNHQQDLALHVLPKTGEGVEDSEESHSLSGHESDGISFSTQDEDRITAMIDHQQTLAGAEDGKSAGRQLISEDAYPQASAELSKPRKIGDRTIDLDQLFVAVQQSGGYATTTARRLWVDVCASCGVENEEESALKLMYETYLLQHENDWIEETGKHRNKLQDPETAGDMKKSNNLSERSSSRASFRSSDRRVLDEKEFQVALRDQLLQLEQPATLERTLLDENESQVTQHWPSSSQEETSEYERPGKVIPRSIRHWINCLRHSPTPSGFIHDLLDLVEKDILETDIKERMSSEQLATRLREMHQKCLDEPGYTKPDAQAPRSLPSRYEELSSTKFIGEGSLSVNSEQSSCAEVSSTQRPDLLGGQEKRPFSEQEGQHTWKDPNDQVRVWSDIHEQLRSSSPSKAQPTDIRDRVRIASDPLSPRVNVSNSVPLTSTPVASPESQVETSQSLSATVTSVETTELDDERTKAKVLFDFTGKTPNELTVESGDLVDILHQGDRGWSLAKSEKEPGPAWVPTTYVEEQMSPTQEQLPKDLNLAGELQEAQETPPQPNRKSKDLVSDLSQGFGVETNDVDEAEDQLQKPIDKSQENHHHGVLEQHLPLVARDDNNATKPQFIEQQEKLVAGEAPERHLENHMDMSASEIATAVPRPSIKTDVDQIRANDSKKNIPLPQTSDQHAKREGRRRRFQYDVHDAKDSSPRADDEPTNADIWKAALEGFIEDVSRRDRDHLPRHEPQQGSSIDDPKFNSSAYFDTEARMRKAALEAQSYQRAVHGGPIHPLTAASIKVPKIFQDSVSGNSDPEESDYRQSATTRATRSSAIGDEDITIKVTASAVLKIGGAEIQCQDGGEININRDGSPGRSGSIIAEPSRSDRGESPPRRRVSRPLPVRARADSRDGRDQDGKDEYVPQGRPPFF